MQRIGVYPGSFDPPTNGHLDIIRRAVPLFDKVIIAVLDNSQKSALFTVGERMEMLKKITAEFKNVAIDKFKELLVEYAKKKKACAVIRGLRAVSDFEYEFQMAQMNRELAPAIETLFMMTSTPYAYLSSSIVKEIVHLGGEIEKFVPAYVEKALKQKWAEIDRK